MIRRDDWNALIEDAMAPPTDAEVLAGIELYRGQTAPVSAAEYAAWKALWRERGIDEIPANGDAEAWAWFHQKHWRLEHPLPVPSPRVRTRRRRLSRS
jgi:hypothetical protein